MSVSNLLNLYGVQVFAVLVFFDRSVISALSLPWQSLTKDGCLASIAKL